MSTGQVTVQPPGRRSLCWPGAALGLAVLTSLGLGSSPTLAQSGDFPLSDNPNAVPTYNIPAATCSTIQQAVSQQVDLILACSIDGRSAEPGPGDTPCDLLDGDVNAGLSVGQCLNSFPTPLLVAERTADVLEADTTVNATGGGLNLALGSRDQISVTAAAGGGSVLGLIDVQSGDCTSGGCDATCGGVEVFQSPTVCSAVSARLAQSVLSTPPPLSHAILLDVQETASSDFLKVAVCPNYRWSCRAPGTTVAGTSYVGQVPFSVVYTPLTARFSRITLCSTCK